MPILFHKYSGSGNDFLIFTLDECARASLLPNGAKEDIKNGELSLLAQRLCHRFEGIGADGLVALKPAHSQSYAYEWDFYNADGSRAEMCGNASRCVGHYAFESGLAGRAHSFLSLAGEIGIEVVEAGECGGVVRSDLGAFKLLQANISESNPYGVERWYLLDTGVPHLVGFVSELAKLPTHKDECLEGLRHRYNANVNLAYVPPLANGAEREGADSKRADSEGADSGRADFENIDSKNTDSDRAMIYATYERGVEDITQACGTGAAAVFAMARELGLCGSEALLLPPSRERLVLGMRADSHILFQGAVRKIAKCEWCGTLSATQI